MKNAWRLETIANAIAADDHARRELLWLRAKEKGDEEIARDLERLDPQLMGRLRVAGLDPADCDDDRPDKRRERFAQLLDECYDHHASLLARAGPLRPPRRPL